MTLVKTSLGLYLAPPTTFRIFQHINKIKAMGVNKTVKEVAQAALFVIIFMMIWHLIFAPWITIIKKIFKRQKFDIEEYNFILYWIIFVVIVVVSFSIAENQVDDKPLTIEERMERVTLEDMIANPKGGGWKLY